MNSKPTGLFLLDDQYIDMIYSPAVRAEIESLAKMTAPPQTAASIRENPPPLAQAELLFSGWGMPALDAAFLAQAPRLKAVFYGAGSLRKIVTPKFWRCDIPIISAYSANAIPVAEFTLAQILFSLKAGWRHIRMTREERFFPIFPSPLPMAGAYHSTVGIISLGAIGRCLVDLLRGHELNLLAYDPFVSPTEAARLGVELCSLPDLFRRADVVTLHAPLLPETEGLVTGELLASMKPNATFINTARGALVREQEMISVLSQRPDLYAVLDVTHPEPPDPASPLFGLPNVILTPHIAGSMGRECQRMGQLVLDELKRYLNGEPLQHRITREIFATMA
jgi:phosphoglycerate dehydrogenase-like enzyme